MLSYAVIRSLMRFYQWHARTCQGIHLRGSEMKLSLLRLFGFVLFFGCNCALTVLQAQELVANISVPVPPEDVSFSGNGDYLLFQYYYGAQLYDVERRQFERELRFNEFNWAPIRCKLNYNAEKMMCAFIRNLEVHVEITDVRSTRISHTLDQPRVSFGFPLNFAFVDRGSYLLVEDWLGEVYVATLASNVWSPLGIDAGSDGTSAFLQSGRIATINKSMNGPLLEVRDSQNSTEADAVKELDSAFMYDIALANDGSRVLLRRSPNDGERGSDVWSLLDSETLNEIGDPLVVSHEQGSMPVWFGERPVALYPETNGVGVTAYDVSNEEILFSIVDASVENVRLSPDGRWIANMRAGGHVEIYALLSDETDADRLPRLVVQNINQSTMQALSISGDGRTVAILDSNSKLSLVDRVSGGLFREFETANNLYTVSLSEDGSTVMVANSSEGEIWDVATGNLLQKVELAYLDKYFNIVYALLLDDRQALRCGPKLGGCILRDFGYPAVQDVPLPLGDSNVDYTYFDVSLSPDRETVALNLGVEGVGWIEFRADGRGGVISVSENATVLEVLALDDARIAVGLSDGDILLVDTKQAIITGRSKTSGRINAIFRSGDENLVVVSSVENVIHTLTISMADFSTLASEEATLPIEGWYIPTVFASSSHDGSVSAFGLDSLVHRGVVTLCNNDTCNSIPNFVSSSPRTVKFDERGEYLLSDTWGSWTLWGLQEGRVVQQLEGIQPTFGEDDFIVYVTDESEVEFWSHRTGRRTIARPTQDPLVTRFGLWEWTFLEASEDGSRIAFQMGYTIFLIRLEEGSVESVARIERENRITPLLNTRVAFQEASDRALLGFQEGGIEMVDATNGDRIWVREDFDVKPLGGVMTFTSDGTGVVVETGSYGPPELLVIDADTGGTRLREEYAFGAFPEPRPVFDGKGIQSLVRVSDSNTLELLSVRDGSVKSSIINWHLDYVDTVEFAVTDERGERVLVVGTNEAVLWDTSLGTDASIQVHVDMPGNVAFSGDGKFMALGEVDGTISFWDISGGTSSVRRLADLITFENGDWAVIAPDGRYDASDPADVGGLAWVMPDEPTQPHPLSIFYREYYEPGLLSRLLAGEEFPDVMDIAELDRTQPNVAVTGVESAGDNLVNVTVEVSEARAEGVRDLKLFRDGRLVGLDALSWTFPFLDQFRDGRLVGLDALSWTFPFLGQRQVTFRNVALPTSGPETVEFSAYAFNDDGVKSKTHRLPYTRPYAEPNARRAFVIVVGVNAYQNQSWDLRYAAADARAGADIVSRHIRASSEFEEVHPVFLIAERDESGAIKGTATRAALLAVLDVLAGEAGDPALLESIPGARSLSKARPDDLVYLAFSGHGLSGENGVFHLFLSDTGEGERREVNSSLLARTLDSDLLARYLLRVDAGEFVMVIDACNSAASVEGGGFKPGPMGSRGLGQIAYDKAMRVLAASQAESIALESGRLRHGLLSFAMLHEGLAGGAADRAPYDNTIEFSELLSYGVERVPLLYEEIQDDSFTPQGRSFAPFRPNGKAPAQTFAQRPSLFDFSRGDRDVRLPVIDQAN